MLISKFYFRVTTAVLILSLLSTIACSSFERSVLNVSFYGAKGESRKHIRLEIFDLERFQTEASKPSQLTAKFSEWSKDYPIIYLINEDSEYCEAAQTLFVWFEKVYFQEKQLDRGSCPPGEV